MSLRRQTEASALKATQAVVRTLEFAIHEESIKAFEAEK